MKLIASVFILFSSSFSVAQEQSVPRLISRLQSKDHRERLQAAGELADLGANAAAAVPHLARALDDSNSDVALWAGYALGDIGPPARTVISQLIETTSDHRKASSGVICFGTPTVAGGAWYALHAIGSPASEQIGALLKSKDPTTRAHALWAISACGDKAKPFWDTISAKTHDPDKSVRYAAVDALGELAFHKKTIPALCKVLQTDDINLRIRAVRAIAKQGEKGSAAVPFLIEQLANEDGTLRGFSAYALGCIGEASRPALPKLRQMLNQNSNDLDDTVFNGGKGNTLEGYGMVSSVSVWARRAIQRIAEQKIR